MKQVIFGIANHMQMQNFYLLLEKANFFKYEKY